MTQMNMIFFNIINSDKSMGDLKKLELKEHKTSFQLRVFCDICIFIETAYFNNQILFLKY